MANRGKDDFTVQTRTALERRVAHSCSKCGVQTVGPSDFDAEGVNNVGIAAHIAGARPGSARYDALMTHEVRRSISNGIWLCQLCGKQVDGDAKTWSVADLKRMKGEAEARAKAGIGRLKEGSSGRLFVEAEHCWYVHHFRAAVVSLSIVNERPVPVSIREAILRLGGVDYRPLDAPVVYSVEVPWLCPPPVRLVAADALRGAWYFGSSFMQAVVARPDSSAELLVLPVGFPPILTKLKFVYPQKLVDGGES